MKIQKTLRPPDIRKDDWANAGEKAKAQWTAEWAVRGPPILKERLRTGRNINGLEDVTEDEWKLVVRDAQQKYPLPEGHPDHKGAPALHLTTVERFQQECEYYKQQLNDTITNFMNEHYGGWSMIAEDKAKSSTASPSATLRKCKVTLNDDFVTVINNNESEDDCRQARSARQFWPTSAHIRRSRRRTHILCHDSQTNRHENSNAHQSSTRCSHERMDKT